MNIHIMHVTFTSIQKRSSNSGFTQVYISTFLFNGYAQDYFFQLKAASEGFTTHNILCEAGNWFVSY